MRILEVTLSNNKVYDCIVIGGGAAGMVSAITAASKGMKTALVEHTKRLGSKLLQTGNGKCNYTNILMEPTMYQNEDYAFTSSALAQFGTQDTITFFKNLGIFPYERNGYIYPNSETAASLQDALRLELTRLQVCVYTEYEVRQIKKASDGLFSLEAGQEHLSARTVILATGSKAAPKTGSDGSGYVLSKSLGHHIIKPLPALVQLISDDSLCKSMAGVRSRGNIVLFVNKSKVAEDYGEIQYTDYGVSGIPVFQISRYAVKAVDAKKDVFVCIDMLPMQTVESLKDDINSRFKRESYKTVEQFFQGMIHKKLVYACAKKRNIDIHGIVSEVGALQLMKIIQCMKAFNFNITGFKPFENAQVCQGGVSLKEIDEATMASKIQEGLFFAGELMDVDGKCGGYNLQWAWSSGYVAGKAAAAFVKTI
jgi:predicted Rossmann fold flavoprotein